MKIVINSLLIFLSIILLVGCSNIKSTDLLNLTLSSSHYELKQDIPYGNNTRQKLDIYLPNSHDRKHTPNNQPTIIFIYGGAWKKGDKKDFKFIGHAFSRVGYRVVIPNYRLYPNVKYPDFVNDVADVIALIDKKENILLNSPSKGFVLMGHSAGAHLAALLATDQSYLQNRNIKIPLKAFVGLAGPYDLDLDNAEVKPIFPDVASPIKVKANQMVNRNTPPTLLLHGKQDTRVLPFHTERMASALSSNNIKHQVKYYDTGHVKIIAGIAEPLRYMNSSFEDIRLFLSNL